MQNYWDFMESLLRLPQISEILLLQEWKCDKLFSILLFIHDLKCISGN
jgi:hypothetical protein